MDQFKVSEYGFVKLDLFAPLEHRFDNTYDGTVFVPCSGPQCPLCLGFVSEDPFALQPIDQQICYPPSGGIETGAMLT